jgi:hypothetical protein
MNYWSPENKTNDQTRLSVKDVNGNKRVSSWYVEDGSFLRIQSVQIGYNLPHRLTDILKIADARFYINAHNLHVFTKYRGYDPEVGNRDNLLMGVDWGIYPLPRSFIFGIQIDI